MWYTVRVYSYVVTRFIFGCRFSQITLQSGTVVCQQVNDRLHLKCWPLHLEVLQSCSWHKSGACYYDVRLQLALNFHWVSELKLSTTLTADCAFHKTLGVLLGSLISALHQDIGRVVMWRMSPLNQPNDPVSWCVLLTDRTRQKYESPSIFSNYKIKVGSSISLTYLCSSRPYITFLLFIWLKELTQQFGWQPF